MGVANSRCLKKCHVMKIMDNLKKNFIKKEPLLYYYMDGQAAAHKSMKAQNGGGPKGG